MKKAITYAIIFILIGMCLGTSTTISIYWSLDENNVIRLTNSSHTVNISNTFIVSNNITSPSLYYTNWDYYRVITINHEYVDTPLTNFSLLIHITDSDLISKIESNGYDLRFCSLNNITEFYYEIELINTTDIFVWVNIGETITSSVDYSFLMYYNNSDATKGESPSNVWDSNFMMVQHMNDYSTTQINDSTTYSNDGSKKGANEPIEQTGKIGYGQDFDGSDDYINLGTQNFGTIYTCSMWVKHEDLPVVQLFLGEMNANSYLFGVYVNIRYLSCPSWHALYFPSTHDNSWHYVVLVRSGITHSVYVDSVFLNSDDDNTNNAWSKPTSMGMRNSERFLNGTMDEVRVSNIVRDQSWIKASYHSQKETSGFLNIGNENENEMILPNDILIVNTTIHQTRTIGNVTINGKLTSNLFILPTIQTGDTLTFYEIKGSIIHNETTNLMGSYNGTTWKWR